MNGIGNAGHSVINHSNSDNLGNSNIRSDPISDAANLATTMIGTANSSSATAGSTHTYNSQTHNSTSNNGIGVSGSQYCVLWNNYHSALVSTVGVLRREGHLLDCTLASTDGGRVSAHQLILAACSTVCRDFIKDVDNKHPIILLPSEIGVQELRAMVEFMYTGQVCIEQDRLKAFIHGARYLRIKGLEDNSDDTDAEEMEMGRDGYKLEVHRESKPNARKLQLSRSGEGSTVTVGGDRRQQESGAGAVRGGSGEEDKDNWEVVERKPIILPQTRPLSPGGSRKRRRLTTSRRRPMHLSNSIVCYEKDAGVSKVGGGGRNISSGGGSAGGYKDVQDDTGEPINKIRRMSTQQGHFHDDMEICTCSSRKTWSVADTEALLRVWGETLTQVPPSYFIRSMSLCKRVARNLQARGVHKNWRQCQVKMKNLRREVRLFKESRSRLSSRKPSEVANACEKLLTEIEEIFNKEEEIRQEWYQLKTDDRQRDDGVDEEIPSSPHQRDILARVAVLADSDLGDEDTDGAGLETEGEGGGYTEGEDGRGESDRRGGGSGRIRVGGDGIRRHHHHGAVVGVETVEDEDMVGIGMEVTTASTFETHHGDTPHHSVHHQPDGTIHHIVEDVSLQHH